MSVQPGTAIEVTGVRKTVRALKEFTPEIHKAMNKSIRESLKFTKETAQSKYPNGAWSLRVNQTRILGQIAASGGVRDSKHWGNSSPGVKAAIFEFAGSSQAGRSPGARGLINSLNFRYGSPGRFLWAAWDETGKAVLQDIRLTVQSAERKLQAHLDMTGESY